MQNQESRGAKAVIEAENIVKTFGKTRALDGFSLRVEAGEVHGFLGPNGAGKTTLQRCLLGLYKIDSGRLEVFGKNPREADNASIAYVPGDVYFWENLRGAEVIDLLGNLRGRRDKAREQELIERFELDPSKKIRTYSKGNRQKVALVAALSAPVDLVLLDEPTSGLDPLMEEVFVRVIQEISNRGRTVFLSSHILSQVERTCTRVTMIRSGQLVDSVNLLDMGDKEELRERFLKHYSVNAGALAEASE